VRRSRTTRSEVDVTKTISVIAALEEWIAGARRSDCVRIVSHTLYSITSTPAPTTSPPHGPLSPIFLTFAGSTDNWNGTPDLHNKRHIIQSATSPTITNQLKQAFYTATGTAPQASPLLSKIPRHAASNPCLRYRRSIQGRPQVRRN